MARTFLRLPKHFLLTSLCAIALAACGSNNSSNGSSSSAGAIANGDSSCQPAKKNFALTDAIATKCDHGNPKPPVYDPSLPAPNQNAPGRACTVDHFTQNGSGPMKKLDVLFVMDTSSRMGHHWTEIAEHLEHFTRHLEGVDLRFAMILGHVDEEEGRLWAPDGEPRVLDSRRMSLHEIREHLYRYFWKAATRFDDRGLGEAGFYSLHKLVRQADEAQKQGFFRNDAALTVLFQSDEQEIGATVPHHLPHGIHPRCDDNYPPEVKKEFYEPENVTVDTTFAAVRALKGANAVSMNAFVNVDEEDMDHYLPVWQHPSDGKLCVYASPGYGYFEMVAKTGGVLRSVHEEPEENLERLGRATHEGLALQHDFTLTHPAKEVDPASIQSVVDGGKTPHTYTPSTDSVHLEYAGKIGSKIDISYCQPSGVEGWEITGLAGTATQTTASITWQTQGVSTSGHVIWGTNPNSLNQTATDPNTAANHAVAVPGLTANTTYYFQAISSDDFGTEKRSAIIAVTTQPVPLPVWSISAFSGTSTQTTVTLTFSTTAYATTGHVLWGTSASNLTNSTAPDSTPATLHGAAVSGLTANTTYYFQAVATDDHGQTHSSAVIAIATQPVPLPTWSITGFTGASTQTSVALQFATSQYATKGHVLWGTSASNLANSTSSDFSAVKTHSFNVSGLAANTTYYFQAVATDDQGQTQSSGVIAVTTQPIPLPVWTIEGFAGTSTQTSVTLTFNTSAYATKGRVDWGPSNALGSSTATDASAVTAHSFTVTGLAPNTTYYFQAVANDDKGQGHSSAVIAVTTQPLPLPVWSITGFAGTSTQTAVALSFGTTQYATTGHVLWGTSPSSLTSSTNADATPSTSHSYNVGGLTANTTYYFQAVATDDRGQIQSSDVIAITTQPIPLPVWSITAFAGTSTQTSVTLNFTTAQYATKGHVQWGASSTDLANNTASDASPANAHTFTVSGLAPNTTYYFQAVATDDRGQTQASTVIAVTTQPVPLPVWSITNMAGTSTQTSVTITFDTAQYGTKGLVRWGNDVVFLPNSTSADPSPVTSHSFTITGLTPNTTYAFQAVATDDRGQTQSSSVISVTTKPIPLPVWTISDFSGTSTQTTVALVFSTLEYATQGHVIWGTSAGSLTNSTNVDSSAVTSHSYSVTGLKPNTTYFFQAVAQDDHGQLQMSPVISVTTAAAPAWSIVGFDATTTTTTANLIWQTGSVATTGVIHVGLSATDLSLMTIPVTTPNNTQVVQVSGLSASTTYFFQVTATDSAGQSQTSNVISKTTKARTPNHN